jgi:hypothetical protein
MSVDQSFAARRRRRCATGCTTVGEERKAFEAEVEEFRIAYQKEEKWLLGVDEHGQVKPVPHQANQESGALLYRNAISTARHAAAIYALENALDEANRKIADLHARLLQIELDNAKRGQDGTK